MTGLHWPVQLCVRVAPEVFATALKRFFPTYDKRIIGVQNLVEENVRQAFRSDPNVPGISQPGGVRIIKMAKVELRRGRESLESNT